MNLLKSILYYIEIFIKNKNMNSTYWPDEQNDFFSTLIGKKIVDARGLSCGSNHVSILFEDGTAIKFYHSQSCCESVELDDIYGDKDDLIGSTLFKLELVTSNDRPRDRYDTSYTWSFYKFQTSKGYVDLRWYGCSNGYYSETVNVEYYQPEYSNWEENFEN